MRKKTSYLNISNQSVLKIIIEEDVVEELGCLSQLYYLLPIAF